MRKHSLKMETHTDKEVSKEINNKVIEGRSKLKAVKDSVPQGSVYGPYLFIIYTNAKETIVKEMGGKAVIYEDDTNIVVEGDTIEQVMEKAEKKF